MCFLQCLDRLWVKGFHSDCCTTAWALCVDVASAVQTASHAGDYRGGQCQARLNNGRCISLSSQHMPKKHTPLSYSLSYFWSTSRQSANWTWMKAVRESRDLYLVFWYEEKGKAFLFLRDVSLSFFLSLSISLIPTFTKCITQQWLKGFDWRCSGCWAWRIEGPVYLDSEGKEGGALSICGYIPCLSICG